MQPDPAIVSKEPEKSPQKLALKASVKAFFCLAITLAGLQFFLQHSPHSHNLELVSQQKTVLIVAGIITTGMIIMAIRAMLIASLFKSAFLDLRPLDATIGNTFDVAFRLTPGHNFRAYQVQAAVVCREREMSTGRRGPVFFIFTKLYEQWESIECDLDFVRGEECTIPKTLRLPKTVPQYRPNYDLFWQISLWVTVPLAPGFRVNFPIDVYQDERGLALDDF